MRKAGWRKLKMEYVTGTMSYRALSEAYGVSFSSLSKVAHKERWTEARKKHRDKVEAKTAEALCARACAREVNRLAALEKAAIGAAEMLGKVLEDPEQFYRHLVAKSTCGVGTDTEERTFSKMDMRAVRDYTAALQTMAATVRNLFGIPTAQEKSAMDIALERLALEKKKAAEGDLDERHTGVVELAAVRETEKESTEAEESTNG